MPRININKGWEGNPNRSYIGLISNERNSSIREDYQSKSSQYTQGSGDQFFHSYDPYTKQDLWYWKQPGEEYYRQIEYNDIPEDERKSFVNDITPAEAQAMQQADGYYAPTEFRTGHGIAELSSGPKSILWMPKGKPDTGSGAYINGVSYSAGKSNEAIAELDKANKEAVNRAGGFESDPKKRVANGTLSLAGYMRYNATASEKDQYARGINPLTGQSLTADDKQGSEISMSGYYDPSADPTNNYTIPFRSDLPASANKQSIIDLVNNKPDPSTWNSIDKANWNYATGNASLPPYNPGGGNQGGNTGGNSGSNGGYNFTPTGDEQLDAMLQQYQTLLDNMLAQGQQVNPNITFTPEEIQRFQDQAAEQIDPYYQSQYTAIKDELKKGLENYKTQYNNEVAKAEESFKSNLGKSREDMSGAGLTFSGVRGGTEKKTADAQSRQLAYEGGQYEYDVNKQLSQVAQKIGSRNLSDLGLSSWSMPQTASLEGGGGFTGNRSIAFNTPSNITGSMEWTQRGERNVRAAQLEEEARKRRILG